jgi:hypothetical protein
MADRAPATAVLFMSILGGAMVTTLLFGRRVWCLHLCPLGRAIGQFSTISMLELRSNSNVCLSQCQTHDCINENGCPMGLHPSSEKTKHDCVLCMACVKSCRHKSVHLDLLLPKQKILSMGKWEFPRAFFAVLLLASVIAIKIPAWVFSHGVSAGAVPVLLNPHSMPGELIIYLAMIAGFTAAVFLASSSANRDAWRRNFIHAGYAYLPMAFFGLFSVYFREFVERGHQILPLTVNLVGLSGAIRSEWVTPNLGTLKGLFPVITLAGAAFSFYLLKEIKEKYSLPPAAYRLNQIVMAAVTVVFLIML